jgi:hypothetical protein
VVRPLDGLERQFWRMGRAAVFNIVAAARVEGPLDAAAVQRGFAAARHRHPRIGARILRSPEGPRFAPGAAPLAVREEPLPPGDGWMRLAEDDLHAPFPDEGPLLRARLLRAPHGQETVLLLAFHHALGDGFAAWALLRDVLTVAGGGALPPEPLPAPAMGPLAVPGELPPAAPADPPAGLAAEGQAPPRERRTRLLGRHLAPPEVQALAATAKAEGTTVQGALAAAMLRAVAREVGPGHHVLGLTSPVSLRERLATPVGEAFGLYAFAPPVFLRVPPDGTPWPLAREIRGALQGLAEGGAAAVLARLEEWVPRDDAGVEQMAERVAAMPPVAAGVTNLGRVAPPPLPGGLELRSFDCAASLEVAGPCVVVYAVTFDGRLDLTFMHAEPLVGRERAGRVADAVVADLRAAAR